MQPAQDRLEPELRAVPDPGAASAGRGQRGRRAEARSGGGASTRSCEQVSSPVRWLDVVQRLAAEGVTTYVEVGPGSVLAGLIKKIQKDAQIVSFSSPEQLDAVLAACSN